MKYVIIPTWLYESMLSGHQLINDVLNYSIMSSLLSGVELSFYIRCNLANYRIFSGLFNTPKLTSRLLMPPCSNVIANDKKFIQFMKQNISSYDMDKPLLVHLILNPSFRWYNAEDSKLKLDFKPILVGKDTLGLIPIRGIVNKNNKHYSLRRDIYEVMRKFMSVDEIVKNPLFGV